VIEPYSDGYTWRINNDGLSKMERIRISVSGVQSFHAGKGAFREPQPCDVPWPAIVEIEPGGLSKREIFITFESDCLRLGRASRMGVLGWPSGDERPTQRWLLHTRVTGLSQEWQFELNVTWTRGTRTIDLLDPNSAKIPPPEHLQADGPGSQIQEDPEIDILDVVSDFNGLDRVPKDDPDYPIWKAFYVEVHKRDAEFSAEQARKAREGEPLDLDEFRVMAEETFIDTIETQLRLVKDMASAAACQEELKTMMSGVLRIFENFLVKNGRDESESRSMLWNLQLRLLELLADAKRKAIEKAERSESEESFGHDERLPKIGGDGGPESDKATELIAERARRRQVVVMPILDKVGWTPGRLVTEAGVGKNSIYQYLDGTRATITDKNRKAIAEALGLQPDQLPG